jgi:UDP-N-acetylglucosamine 2-epimerase (non-hydrolysing)
MRKISIILGTRPEAIKLAPIILALKKMDNVVCDVCITAQHRQMLDQALEIFEIVPDTDLNLMVSNQTLGSLTASAINTIDKYLAKAKPDIVLVQGDTTTVLCGALAAFYHKIPVGHIEAGLRTGNIASPWPEEINRVLTTRIVRWHFAPTLNNRQNLLNEGILDENIFVTGNTVIDTLFLALKKIKTSPPFIEGLPNKNLEFLNNQPMILITGHRRENFGEGFENICFAIADLAKKFTDVQFIYPVHLNPNVQEPVYKILGNDPSFSSRVHLIPPQTYLPFVSLMNNSYLILTDSGGVQEEAPSLGKPVLVMRDTTERPEALASGTVKLVGTDRKQIFEEVSRLLTDTTAYKEMIQIHNPYGDGKATERIINVLMNVKL